jgi:hypothetical protein
VNEEAGSERRLSGVVRHHLERSVPKGPVPRQMRIRQEGEMWLKPGARGMRFTATQFFAVERVAFSWQARFPLLGSLALSVVDEYADGDGRLEVRLFGLPLQRQRGPETVAGEALRYLAELPFVPPAIEHNRELEWRELDQRSAEVAARVRDERLVVKVEVDADGDIVQTSSQMRRRKVDGEWVTTPWGGRFGNYKTLGGMRVPTSGEAYWELPDGRYVYWRGNVISAEPLTEPFWRNGS